MKFLILQACTVQMAVKWLGFFLQEAVLGMGSSDSSVVLIRDTYLMKVFRRHWSMLLAKKYHS